VITKKYWEQLRRGETPNKGYKIPNKGYEIPDISPVEPSLPKRIWKWIKIVFAIVTR
jgi:hypothetical protein